jgi:hypothetical protein
MKTVINRKWTRINANGLVELPQRAKGGTALNHEKHSKPQITRNTRKGIMVGRPVPGRRATARWDTAPYLSAFRVFCVLRGFISVPLCLPVLHLVRHNSVVTAEVVATEDLSRHSFSDGGCLSGRNLGEGRWQYRSFHRRRRKISMEARLAPPVARA